MKFIGRNSDFVVVWDCSKQSYTAYKNGRVLAVKHRFRDVASYLD